LQEPFTKLFIPAISQSADEVRNVVVGSVLSVVSVLQSRVLMSTIGFLLLESAFEGQFVFIGKAVSLLNDLVFILVRVMPSCANTKLDRVNYLHKFNFPKYLESVKSNGLELVEGNDVLRSFIIHVNLDLLGRVELD
jgi:hypothetical protein